MAALPDDAQVVRGGRTTPESFAEGSGVSIDSGGKIDGVSVNAGAGLSVKELTAPDSRTGYPGIPHNQIGVTTVGQIRTLGGDVAASPTKKNPNHAVLSGLKPEEAARLFRPTIKNPNRTQ